MDRLRSGIPKVAILVSTLAIGAIFIPWADREFRQFDLTHSVTFSGSRPDWVYALNRPYRHLDQVWPWACMAATLGSGVVLLDPRSWRRPMEPTTIIVLAALTASMISSIDYLIWPPIVRASPGDSYNLGYALRYRVPGAILGALVVTFRRPIGWRGNLIAAMWLVGVALNILYSVIFG